MPDQSISENPPFPVLKNDEGTAIAVRHQPGRGTGILFIGGYNSAMTGEKARFLAGWCAVRGYAFTRFDPTGHGESGGRFEDGTIGRWLADALLVLDAVTEGPQILVGSSMGGWLMALIARRRPDRVRALVGIAAAPDFVFERTAALLPEERLALQQKGEIRRPSRYGGDYVLTASLLREATAHRLLGQPLEFNGPVRLLHGMQDPDVPWDRSRLLLECVTSADARLILIKDGDHRLSRPQDLALLASTLSDICG